MGGWALGRKPGHSHNRKIHSYQVEAHWYQDYAHQCDSDCPVPGSQAVEAEAAVHQYTKYKQLVIMVI